MCIFAIRNLKWLKVTMETSFWDVTLSSFLLNFLLYSFQYSLKIKMKFYISISSYDGVTDTGIDLLL